MKSGKSHHEEEEEEDEYTKDASPSTNNNKDRKNSDKANVIRSKHSVTEQRRRSKINERFQILRELIPNSDPKRDTASFLLEVIQYVQFLHEKVQKYEGSYQHWSSEPTKPMQWRNSHWHVQSFSNHPQATMDGPVPGSAFPIRFDENGISAPTTSMAPSQPNPIDPDLIRDASCRSIDPQNELPSKAPVTNDGAFSHTLLRPVSDAQSSGADTDQDGLAIEGGTISISSIYSDGLLNSLTQALHSTGVDLSQTNLSVQINLGKRANRGTTQGISIDKDRDTSGNQSRGTFRDASENEDLDPIQKRPKI